MSSRPNTVITITGQRASNREPASASDIFPILDPQALEVPRDTPRLECRRLTNATSFRLLKILSDGCQDILRCSMFDADLAVKDTPRYIAVSYSWHEESLSKTSHPVLINDKYLSISLKPLEFSPELPPNSRRVHHLDLHQPGRPGRACTAGRTDVCNIRARLYGSFLGR